MFLLCCVLGQFPSFCKPYLLVQNQWVKNQVPGVAHETSVTFEAVAAWHTVVRAAGCLFQVEGFELNYFGFLQASCLQLLVPEAGGRNNLVNDLTIFRDKIFGICASCMVWRSFLGG